MAKKQEHHNMEGIRLRRREADDTNPRIPAVDAVVSGSFVQRRIGEIWFSQWPSPMANGSTRRTRIIIR